ncbi:protein SABRE-like [Curcuma longa]|uniref:protein SABRE-like n=1 Tax=Curcuma longa TaxID=136217 RepID=UPI003D9E3F02
MALFLLKFFFGLAVFCAVGWVFSVFLLRLLALILNKTAGISVAFQVSGCNCLKDVFVTFKKGGIESILIGEIKLTLRESLFSKDQKLQLLISDLEVYLCSPAKSTKKSKSRNRSSRPLGKGVWAFLYNIARFLSVYVTEINLKGPKSAAQVRGLRVDALVDQQSKFSFNLKLQLAHFGFDILSEPDLGEPSSLTLERLNMPVETKFSPFTCEDFSFICELSYKREVGVKFSNLDVSCGMIGINLKESLFIKTKRESKSSVGLDASKDCASDNSSVKSENGKSSTSTMKKHVLAFPEQVSFNIKELDVMFMHQGQGIVAKNTVTDILLRSVKTLSYDDAGEATSHFSLNLDFSQIHLLKEGVTSMLEISEVAIIARADVPMQPLPISAEVDLKISNTRCNLIVSRLRPWICLKSGKQKPMVLREESPNQENKPKDKMATIMWKCTVSLPEITLMIHNVHDSPLFHGCFLSFHLFANNIESKKVEVHAELGQFHLNTEDVYQQSLEKKLIGADINSSSLVHIEQMVLDFGNKEMESQEGQEAKKLKLVLAVDMMGMSVFFGLIHVERLIKMAMSFKELLKDVSPSSKKIDQDKAKKPVKKDTSKGINIVKCSLQRLLVKYSGETSLSDMTVADPKRVNFGSQGGQTIISVGADGKLREASISSLSSNSCKLLNFSTSVDILHLRFVFNKEKQSMQIEVDSTNSFYSEYTEEQNPGTEITLLTMQKAKFVRRSSGHNDMVLCSLLNVTDLSIRWEPDVHLALQEFAMSLKYLMSNQKNHSTDHLMKAEAIDTAAVPNKELISDQSPTEKQQKKRDSIFAIDLEMLKVSAGLADGVETVIHVQSIFSENAKIGVLFEEVMISFNEARMFRTSRLQVSRIPATSIQNLQDSKSQMATARDWVIRSPDIYICMPYRLQLRAIDDAVEDTLRALKLISAAKLEKIVNGKKNITKKSKSTSNFFSVRLIIRKLTVEIEEEPIQAWLDEHYQLMKKEVCEAAVRLKFLDELLPTIASSSPEPNNLGADKKIHYNGMEIDASDASSVELLRTEIYKKAFRSYYEACQKIETSEGSGINTFGFQSGFKPSIHRVSLMSVCATELDATLRRIDSDVMLEFLKMADPICSEKDIPFSKLYGCDIDLNAESLAVKIRDYTHPLFHGSSAKCQGRVVVAQQATSFQPQILQDCYVGRWWRVRMLRSASGTTPANKVYLDLPINFQKGEVSFGVGYEPVFADISYAFTVALRRANLGTRSCTDPHGLDYSAQFLASSSEPQPPIKEKSLPWWDEMRNYIHGKTNLSFVETQWFILGTSNPYEKLNNLEIISANMEIQQRDGYVGLWAREFKVYTSSLESLTDSLSLKSSTHISSPFLVSSSFLAEVQMEWGCESGSPLNHYLFSLPIEGKPRMKVYDPFRSIALSLKWNFSLNNSQMNGNGLAFSSDLNNTRIDGPGSESSQKIETNSIDSPTMKFCAHDLAWLNKFCVLNYLPPHKLRMFSRWPRFGVPRIVRSGNLSLDRVMTEFFLRIDATPLGICYAPLRDDDPANGMTLKMSKLKYEICFSRGRQEFTFDCMREPLDLVYQGFDIHMLTVSLDQINDSSITQEIIMGKRSSRNEATDKFGNENCNYGCKDKTQGNDFLLYSDYFTIRRQTAKADPTRLLAWQEYGRKDLEMNNAISEIENGIKSNPVQSDFVDDEGFTVVIADNCQRVFVYGLKLLWTLEYRNAVLSMVRGISKAFEPSKPSPSKLYSKRKLLESQKITDETDVPHDPELNSMADTSPCGSPIETQNVNNQAQDSSNSSVPSAQTVKQQTDTNEEGTCHFMVNVIQPQFNLHSEEAKGRFLLAAASGRVLARSFRSIVHVGPEIIEQALSTSNVVIPDNVPEMTWKRMELSMMLEHVQAHVAPTDIDPGAGIQWLPKILKDSPTVKRTGPLLERVFMPCQMYFQYTQYKGGTPELKVKPLKELTFNSPNITSEMTSRHFRIMLDVLTNLLFARSPKFPPSIHSLSDVNEDIGDEFDRLVPDGVEEVDLAKINLEKRIREHKLLLSDVKVLGITTDKTDGADPSPDKFDLWMVEGSKPTLLEELKKEQGNIRKAIKEASSALRLVLQEAAEIRLLEKEKNKSPSCAIRIYVRINKVVWSMLSDDRPFAEVEINDMIYDFDRDYTDIGIAQLTTKLIVVKNCVANSKSDTLLSAWNAPPEWGKRVMLRVNAKQGAPKDGKSRIEHLQVEIYPLRIHLTETMYTMMWDYLFPEEEQDSLKRQEVWKVSTTSGTKRGKKTSQGSETAASSNQSAKESEAPGKSTAKSSSVTSSTEVQGDSSQVKKAQNPKSNTSSNSNPELRRTSSLGRTWEETVADSVANELILQSMSTQSGLFNSATENKSPHAEDSKNKTKDSKALKSGSQITNEEKKVVKSNDDKRARQKMQEFHNIKISQVELLVTYEGSRIAFSDFRLLMDTFHRDEFTGSWRRLFARIKKHIVWGVLKSVAGMQGKKFKDKTQTQKDAQITALPDNDPNLSDSDGDQQRGKSDQFPMPFPKRGNDGAGDGFVTSIRGLFNTQKKKAKAYVLRTMRGEGDNEHGEWSDGDVELSPFARQLTIAKTKKLIRRHSKKFVQSTSGKHSKEPMSPKDMMLLESDSSGELSYGEDN